MFSLKTLRFAAFSVVLSTLSGVAGCKRSAGPNAAAASQGKHVGSLGKGKALVTQRRAAGGQLATLNG
jgi:hypothetical protein